MYFNAARERGEESLKYLSRQWGLTPKKKATTEVAEQQDLFSD